jgi:hypothetical protein
MLVLIGPLAYSKEISFANYGIGNLFRRQEGSVYLGENFYGNLWIGDPKKKVGGEKGILLRGDPWDPVSRRS